MNRPNYVTSYQDRLRQLVQAHGCGAAIELIVGGLFQETGVLEKHCLLQLGLEPHHTVVDVGCGSGRLPFQLKEYLTGHFVGTDILPEALEHARTICQRPDWRFEQCTDILIPVPDGTADFVTFFSVFTHLLDEDIFRYLLEAHRVVKSSGKIVFSFLDFDCDAHWYIFQKTVEDRNPNRVLNKFITKDTARRLARGAGFLPANIYDGLEKWISTPQLSADAVDQVSDSQIEFGQSVAVLRSFPEASYLARHPDVAAAIQQGLFYSGAHHYDVCGHREGRAV